jgi:PIN domain nuclease of toxin-antitoxin system
LTTPPPTIEPLYVVDTNALLWYLTQDKKLSKRASDIFAAAEGGETRLYLSVITLAELYYINQRWHHFDDFTQLWNDLKSKPYFRFVPFRPEEVAQFAQDAAVPEMHDRIIAGLARRLRAPLVSSDPLIRDAKIIQVVW